MLRGCATSVQYGNLYVYGLFYNAFIFSYSVRLPFFYVLSFVLSVFFCNDHLISVSRRICRCSGTSCGWGAINLGGRVRLYLIRYNLLIVGQYSNLKMYVCNIIVVLSDMNVLVYHIHWTI